MKIVFLNEPSTQALNAFFCGKLKARLEGLSPAKRRYAVKRLEERGFILAKR